LPALSRYTQSLLIIFAMLLRPTIQTSANTAN